MKDFPYKNTISPKAKAVIVIASLIFIGIAVGFIFSTIGFHSIKDAIQQSGYQTTDAQERRFSLLYTASMIINCVDIILLIGILWIYLDSYRKTKSSFMLGLTFFIGVLFTRSIVALVTIHSLFIEYVRAIPVLTKAFVIGGGFSTFNFFLNIFEIIAISILLYLSME
ncbi:Uncharacterised protein [uncultured archaeon]|nr:Uncharacterised protein [uncultured archaeon]